MKKIGIMGGTFDPIHHGHLIAAQEVMQQLGLAQVVFVPSGMPPLKDAAKVAASHHRYAMCFNAVMENSNFRVSRIEVDREGPSYTVDTIAQLRCDLPHCDLYFIVGADATNSFHKWRRFNEILQMCKIVVTTRPGNTPDIAVLNKYSDHIITVAISDIDISSTKIRDLIARNLPFSYLLPQGVHEYIIRRGLYTGQLERIKKILQLKLSEERFYHSLYVMGEAVNLGKCHSVGEEVLAKLELAGLLHDCAKNFCDERTFEEIENRCSQHGITLDTFFAQSPRLAHGALGIVFAKSEFDITDPEILDAIACHTFGKPNMTIIDKIVYIADFIEPTRATDESRIHARKLAYENLDAAMIYILRHTIEKTTARGKPVYKDSLAALEYLEDK